MVFEVVGDAKPRKELLSEDWLREQEVGAPLRRGSVAWLLRGLGLWGQFRVSEVQRLLKTRHGEGAKR